MATVGSILLGIVNIGIVVALLLLLGAIVEWFLRWIAGVAIPDNIRKLYLLLVALIAVYMLAAQILGLPSITVIPHH